MTTNAWLHPQQGFKPEQDLYEGMIIENIQISGNDVIFLPRTLSGEVSQIFGEDVLSSFDSYATIEMWLTDFSCYGGDSEMLSKFGMEIRDTATFLVSRKRFFEECTPIAPVSRNHKIKYRPCEGDLIFVPFSNSLFEIKFVEDEQPGFYQLNKKYIWSLRCELVALNNETFNTGNTLIDEMFGNTLNRLGTSILGQDSTYMLTEDGGRLLAEEYVIAEQYTDLNNYGDNESIKKEFLQIMNWDSDNPFNERI